MRSLSAADLLDAWERALACSALERPLVLLAAATDDSRGDLAQLPIGVRNALLLELRAREFGNEIDAVATCPACGETLELHLRISDLIAPPPVTIPPPRELRVNGFVLTYRLPNTNDLVAALGEPDTGAARETLLRRVVANGGPPNEPNAHSLLDPRVLDALTTQLEQDDPLAVLRVELTCPHCQHEWSSVFDIAAYFWMELDAWAKRIVRQVHALASAYGWGEDEILAQSPQRRQLYLELVGS